MRVSHWLIGGALCMAGIGSAAAASLGTQDMDTSAHAAADSTSPRDANNCSGDALGLNHDSPTPSNDSPNSASSNSNDRSGGGVSAPARPRQAHLGWQSLLPGSIQ